MTLSLIVAASANEVIGRDGALPWHLPEDLRHFKTLTYGNVVLMGRLTHESILARLGHPLPGRTSVVVSRSSSSPLPDVVFVPSVAEGLATSRELAEKLGNEIFVIGGASIYEQTLPEVDRIFLTRIHREVEGDTTMPDGWLTPFTEISRTDFPGYSFIEYRR